MDILIFIVFSVVVSTFASERQPGRAPAGDARPEEDSSRSDTITFQVIGMMKTKSGAT